MQPVVVILLLVLATLAAMHWSAQLLARQSSRLFGRRIQLYLFGLLGTIVHEGSHVIACVLFRHRVHRIRWFDPLAMDGSLGSVEHSYDPSSAYQRLGTIVIGIAPLLVGALVILVAAQILLQLSVSFTAWSAPGAFVMPVFAKAEWWRWALFAYICISVGGSMHLSRSDVRGTWRGIVTLAIIGVSVALLVQLARWTTEQASPMYWSTHVAPVVIRAGQALSLYCELLIGALLLAVVINVIGAAVLFVLSRLIRS